MHAVKSLRSSKTYSEFFRACLKLTDRLCPRAEPDRRRQFAGPCGGAWPIRWRAFPLDSVSV